MENPLSPLVLAGPVFFKSIYHLGLIRHSRSWPAPFSLLLHREFYSTIGIVDRPGYFI
jgi:hypothetical protein